MNFDPAPQPEQDFQLLRAVLERFLTPHSEFSAPVLEPARLLLGEIPPLPFRLPLPPDAVVVGSISRDAFLFPGRGGQRRTISVLVDIPALGPSIFAFLDTNLPKSRWKDPRRGRDPQLAPGFSSFPREPRRTYCMSANGPWFTVAQYEREPATREVHFHIDLTSPGPCSQLRRRSRLPEHHRKPIPRLTAPPGMWLHDKGGGWDEDGGQFFAIAGPGLTVVELESEFGRQLEAAGWERQSLWSTGPSASSLWTVPKNEPPIKIAGLSLLEKPDGSGTWIHLDYEIDTDAEEQAVDEPGP